VLPVQLKLIVPPVAVAVRLVGPATVGAKVKFTGAESVALYKTLSVTVAVTVPDPLLVGV
jgi:hypothetical protein